MLYSVRMRAAQGGDHAAGGRHISGAECLAGPEELTDITRDMLERARTHSRGCADFINITVEAVAEADIRRVTLLPVITVPAPDVAAGRKAALEVLAAAGVSPVAADAGLEALLALPDSMRGAMLLCAATGRRLDDTAGKGIRVSRLDCADRRSLACELEQRGLGNVHVREALVLASKVASAPGVTAELCWSDDPEYTAGYVASSGGYIRFPHLKEYGNAVGGRVFFVRPDADLAVLVAYLELQPVLVTLPGGEGVHG